MSKHGRDRNGRALEISPAPPGTDFVAEMLAAERLKVAEAIRLTEYIAQAMREEDYDAAMKAAQVLLSAIIHAGNASGCAARYGELLAKSAGPAAPPPPPRPPPDPKNSN